MTNPPQPAPYANWQQPRPVTLPPRRQRNLLPWVVVTVVVVLLAGVFVAMVLQLRPSGDNDGPVAGQLGGTYPSKPSVGWRLGAGEVFDRAAFMRPDPTSAAYLMPGFIDLGDTLVTAAYLPQTDRGLDLVAIDVQTGRVRWVAPLHAGTHEVSGLEISGGVCATRTINGELPCLVGDIAVQFFDIADGTVKRSLPVDDASVVEVHGDSVYTLGRNSISRGTPTDLDAHWQQSYTSASTCSGSGDSYSYGVTDDVVYFGTDHGIIVAATDDGRPLIDPDPTYLVEYPGQGLVATLCTGGSTIPTQQVVVDTHGQVLRTMDSTASGGTGPFLVRPGADIPYLRGNAAHDFATGEQRWVTDGGSRTGGIRHGPLDGIIGNVVLTQPVPGSHRDADLPLSAFDLATGEHLWTNESLGPIEMSDGQRVIVRQDGGLTSVNLATGGQEWQVDGIDYVAPAGDGFAAYDRTSITYYPPTGGRSVAPGLVGHTDTEATTDAVGELVTACGRTPEMRPIEYRTEDGGMVVKMEIKAACPGGDLITTDRLRVTIRDGHSPICSGVFDFSTNPLLLGGEGSAATTVELWFADDAIWRLPNTLGKDTLGTDSGPAASPSGGVVTSAAASGNEVVDCVDEGSGSGPTSTSIPPGRDRTDQKRTSTQGADDCGSEADALDALRTQVDADRRFVQSDLADRWVAQLSSKQPGLVAPDVDGRMVDWNACEILRQHLRLRLQYPEVRLVWSDEWSTFDLRGWWVTFAGVTFPGPDAANGWCDERAIPVDECYAKLVSNNRDSRGSTKYRR